MFCPKCGFQNSDEAAFCGSCGAQLVSAAAASPAAAAVAAPRAKGGSKKPAIIIAAIVIAIVVIVGVIFGVTTCAGGSDKLTPGIYELSTKYGPAARIVLEDEGKATISDPGGSSVSVVGIYDKSVTCAYEATGKQGNSTIYDVSDLRSANGQYYDENGVYYDKKGVPEDDYTLEALQIMIPRGGTTGKVAGTWGLLNDRKLSDGTHGTEVLLLDVKDDGTGVAYALQKSHTLDTPTFDVEAVAAEVTTGNTYDTYANSCTFTWKEVSEGTYQITTQYSDVYTITMPTKK